VISIADRAVHITGITTRPDETWLLQIGRNLVDEAGGALIGKKYLIIDRDKKYSRLFREFVAEGGTEVIRFPPLSPSLNAFAERFVRSIKEECLEKMILVGQVSLRRAITEYVTHFYEERADKHIVAGLEIDAPEWDNDFLVPSPRRRPTPPRESDVT